MSIDEVINRIYKEYENSNEILTIGEFRMLESYDKDMLVKLAEVKEKETGAVMTAYGCFSTEYNTTGIVFRYKGQNIGNLVSVESVNYISEYWWEAPESIPWLQSVADLNSDIQTIPNKTQFLFGMPSGHGTGYNVWKLYLLEVNRDSGGIGIKEFESENYTEQIESTARLELDKEKKQIELWSKGGSEFAPWQSVPESIWRESDKEELIAVISYEEELRLWGGGDVDRVDFDTDQIGFLNTNPVIMTVGIGLYEDDSMLPVIEEYAAFHVNIGPEPNGESEGDGFILSSPGTYSTGVMDLYGG